MLVWIALESGLEEGLKENIRGLDQLFNCFSQIVGNITIRSSQPATHTHVLSLLKFNWSEEVPRGIVDCLTGFHSLHLYVMWKKEITTNDISIMFVKFDEMYTGSRVQLNKSKAEWIFKLANYYTAARLWLWSQIRSTV